MVWMGAKMVWMDAKMVWMDEFYTCEVRVPGLLGVFPVYYWRKTYAVTSA